MTANASRSCGADADLEAHGGAVAGVDVDDAAHLEPADLAGDHAVLDDHRRAGRLDVVDEGEVCLRAGSMECEPRSAARRVVRCRPAPRRGSEGGTPPARRAAMPSASSATMSSSAAPLRIAQMIAAPRPMPSSIEVSSSTHARSSATRAAPGGNEPGRVAAPGIASRTIAASLPDSSRARRSAGLVGIALVMSSPLGDERSLRSACARRSAC